MPTNDERLPGGIAATVRTPEGEGRRPVVVLCHGFCGIKEILLPAFAQAFADAGFASVAFDYHGFGASDGERGRLVPSRQIADILEVVDWVSADPRFDAGRIGLWGTSLGGCHVMGAAAARPAVKCVVSQLPFADGDRIVTGSMASDERLAFIATLDKMADKRAQTGKEMMVGITRVLTDPESRAFFEDNKTRYPDLDIKIPFLTVRETLLYRPMDDAKQVECPTLVVVAGEDTVNPAQQGIDLYDHVGSADKQLWVEQGARHYDVYQGPHFDSVVGHELDWLKRHL